MPDQAMPPEPVDVVFTALSDPTRRALLERMAEAGTITPSRLASGLPITRQAVSRHLLLLEEAGLARSTMAGRERRYAVEPGGLALADDWITRAEARWAGRLQALKAFVEGE